MRETFGSARRDTALILTFCGVLLISENVFSQGGPCPASSPLAGNSTCFFIAATGSDANNGTSESTPWLHAPGMPNCSGNCATEQKALGSENTANPGVGFVFRGGDTWHFGNSSASPYVGGTYTNIWSGGSSSSNCEYEGNQTGCLYIGVDLTWYNSSACGSSWCRPIFNGDNPTSTSLVSSCAYGAIGSSNIMFSFAVGQTGVYLDGIEFTGLCSHALNVGSASTDLYIYEGWPPSNSSLVFKNNIYIHGWTLTAADIIAGESASAQPCYLMTGGFPEVLMNSVIDNSDSYPGGCGDDVFPNVQHWKNNAFRYGSQIVANACHDIHDNIFEYWQTNDGLGHGNVFECNADGDAGPAEVFYNNIFRHTASGFAASGEVGIWRCPDKTPQYWFNNLIYDFAGGFQYATGGFCDNSGGQYMFNNTLVDMRNPCYIGGQHLTVYNEHLIGSTPWDSGATSCNGGPSSSTNVVMSDSKATSQGYTTGAAGLSMSNTCASESSNQPCTPTAASTGTVAAGANEQAYCSAMAAMATTNSFGAYDPSVAVDAANACKYATTDACSYNSTTHSMNCPAQTPVQRPASGNWDAGAYQDPPSSQPQPPTNVQATAH